MRPRLPAPLRSATRASPLGAAAVRRFRTLVLGYFHAHARSFPWRETRDPYRILVSEVMLQQTRTESVRRVWPSFLARFPTVRDLARADTRELLRAWLGLGYNRRALALRECALRIVREHGGTVPSRPETLRELPGIGSATAASIAAFAYDVPVAFIETNIRRVFLYFFFPGRRHVHDREILPLVELTLDRARPGRWYSALMDYGVMMKGLLPASRSPNRRSAHYAPQTRFEGSDRQIRGQVLRILTTEGPRTPAQIREKLDGRAAVGEARLTRILDGLVRDGFARRGGRRLGLAR